MSEAPTSKSLSLAHQTQPCERALGFDSGIRSGAVRAGSGLVFAMAAAAFAAPHFGSLRQPQRLQALRLALALLAALLGYCPLGRLAFARPLRRAAQALDARSSIRGGLIQSAATFGRAVLLACRSVPGAAALCNGLLAPALLSRLAASRVPGSGVVRIVLETLCTMIASASATTAVTLLHPGHLIPSNPWRLEPGRAGVELEHDRVGVLVCNLGTTMSPAPRDVYAFLKPFLSDPRVVEIAPPVWLTVLNLVILPRRKHTSGALYKRFFKSVPEAGTRPPLIYYTEQLVDALRINSEGCYEVEVGMRYGQPSIEQGLRQLKARGCSRVLVFPLYPQYSGTTSASIYDEVFAQAQAYRFVPSLRIAQPYYAHPAYIKALAGVTRSCLASQPFDIEVLVISFHGIPERYHLRGDPYPFHCEATAKALVAALGLSEHRWTLSYQSVFGRDPWLRPATDETIGRLGKQGVKRVAVVCPGFLSDCLETVDEVGHENRKIFMEAGGEEYVLVPCLNADPTWCSGASEILAGELKGWL